MYNFWETWGKDVASSPYNMVFVICEFAISQEAHTSMLELI